MIRSALPCAIATAIALTLSGCESMPTDGHLLDPLIFGVKCAGTANPEACKAQSKAEADAHSAKQSQASSGTSANGAENCAPRSVKVSGPVDVDIAYARAKSRHEWNTAEEATDGAYLFPADNFKHVATPGAFYDLVDYASFKTRRGADETIFMRITLMKAPRGTDLAASYCLKPNELYADADVKAQLRQIVR